VIPDTTLELLEAGKGRKNVIEVTEETGAGSR
jgi:hypothetical protein